jgi:thiol-disulfide isomerase/thioredoxin
MPFRRCRRAALVLALILTSAMGCGKSDTSSEKTSGEDGKETPAESLTAEQVLQRMVAAYQQAATYSDAGVVQMHIVGPQGPEENSIPLAVQFTRKGQLAIAVQDFRISTVGDRLFCRAIGPSAAGFDGQVIVRGLPDGLTYGAVASLIQPLLAGDLVNPIVLELLVGMDPFADAKSLKLLDSQAYDGKQHLRLKYENEDRRFTFWIDPETFTLRRYDVSSNHLLANIPPEHRPESMQVFADLVDAKLNGKINPAAFSYRPAANAKLVRDFVPPPRDTLPPSLGKPIGKFAFADLKGRPLDNAAIKGKIAVFDFWFTTCPPCRLSMPLLERVYQRYKDDDQVVIRAVNTDATTLTNDQVKETLTAWGVTVPAVRDPSGDSASVFQQTAAPTLVLIGPDGRVHDFSVGLHEDLPTQLPKLIEALREGKDVGASKIIAYREAEKEYERRLKAAHPDASHEEQIIELPKISIAKASEPTLWKRTTLWTSDEASAPNNILAVPTDDGSDRLLVVNEYRSVVELDAAGKAVATHELNLPETSLVGYLRTTLDAKGKRLYVAAGSGQKRLFVFDHTWKQQLAFPPADFKSSDISEVQIADMDGDKTPEMYVSYWQEIGVQQVSLSGKRTSRWGGRTVRDVPSTAIIPAAGDQPARLVCASLSGGIVLLDHAGKTTEVTASFRGVLQHLAVADGEPDAPWCGLLQGQRDATVVWINAQGQQTAKYQLLAGLPRTMGAPLLFGRVISGDERHWIVAGGDGSLRFFKTDGTLVDRFHHGASIEGMTTAILGGKPALVVASPGAVTAYRLEP